MPPFMSFDAGFRAPMGLVGALTSGCLAVREKLALHDAPPPASPLKLRGKAPSPPMGVGLGGAGVGAVARPGSVPLDGSPRRVAAQRLLAAAAEKEHALGRLGGAVDLIRSAVDARQQWLAERGIAEAVGREKEASSILVEAEALAASAAAERGAVDEQQARLAKLEEEVTASRSHEDGLRSTQPEPRAPSPPATAWVGGGGGGARGGRWLVSAVEESAHAGTRGGPKREGRGRARAEGAHALCLSLWPGQGGGAGGVRGRGRAGGGSGGGRQCGAGRSKVRGRR